MFCHTFASLGLSFLLSAAAGAANAPGEWPLASRNLVATENARRFRAPVNAFELNVLDNLQLTATGWEFPLAGRRRLRVLENSPEFVTPAGERRGLFVSTWEGAPGSPLAVYLPGIFQMSNDADTARMVDALRETGHTVVVIANPLSAEYMANDPVAPGASYAVEAAIIRDAIADVRERFGAGPVRLLGASHGANLAARAWALDQNRREHDIQDLTLLFPQVNMARSIALVDSYIDAPKWSNPARAMIGGIYRSALKNYVRRRQRLFVADAAEGFVSRTYSERAAHHLARFRKNGPGDRLTLKSVIRDYVDDPVVTRAHEDGSTLFDILNEAHAGNGATAVRLITAEDDWTNPPGAWRGRPAWLEEPGRRLVLKRGAHAGVVAQSWFRAVIVAAMR